MPTINSISKIKTLFTPHSQFDIDSLPKSSLTFTQSICSFASVLNQANIQPVLLYGTCLGIYRDQKIIEYDTDADFGVRLESFDELLELTDTLFKAGFYIQSRNMYCVTYGVTNTNKTIDVWVIVKRKNPFFRLLGYRWLVDHVNYKANYFESFQPTEFHQQTCFYPTPVEDYLCELYGEDWHIPQQNRHAGPRSILSQLLNAPFVDFKMPSQFSGDNIVGTYKPWFSILLKRFAPNSKLCQLFKHPE
ncbi:MAG: LicD family protein [Candidatus Margulisiibacteriota bacterium]